MSASKGRPPIENPKSIRLEIRMTVQEAAVLNECAERLSLTRTDVINKGVAMVKAELDKK